MSARKAHRHLKQKKAVPPSTSKRLDDATLCIFRAQSIISCCRLICGVVATSKPVREMVFALEASVNLLDDAAKEIDVVQRARGKKVRP